MFCATSMRVPWLATYAIWKELSKGSACCTATFHEVDRGVLEVERDIQVGQTDGAVGGTLSERSVGAESSGRRCRDAGHEVHHATRRIKRKAVGGRDGVEGAGLDGIVVGVAVVDEWNIANTEAAADHGVRRSAVGEADARRDVR